MALPLRTGARRPVPSRLLVGAVLTAALCSALPAPAGAAPALPPVTVTADEVQAARTAAQQAREEVGRVAVQLTEGTQRWEAGTVELERARAAASPASPAPASPPPRPATGPSPP